MLNRNLKIRIKLYLTFLLSKRDNSFSNVDKDRHKVIVALAADYGNLGDVAITYAQTVFLKEIFPDSIIIDFPISKTFKHFKVLKSIVKPNDIITIVGGGNTGDMYDDIEYCRQFIIKKFSKNKIVCFPQTIDFSETKTGQKAIARAIKVYGKNKNLSISAREEKSFNKFTHLFVKNSVIMAPDIVLFLDETKNAVDRKGITFILREDGEKNICKDYQKELIDLVASNYFVKFQDTHINKSKMSVDERKVELDVFWNVIRASKLVVTDRLHGMIFCAITNTPCIAIDNSNKKVSGVYSAWLKDNPNIKVLENFSVSDAIKSIEQLLENHNKEYTNLINQNNFDSLIKLLKE